MTTDSTLSAESESGSTCCCAPSACSQRSSARRRSRNAARHGGSREPVAVVVVLASTGEGEHWLRGQPETQTLLPRRHRRGTQEPETRGRRRRCRSPSPWRRRSSPARQQSSSRSRRIEDPRSAHSAPRRARCSTQRDEPAAMQSRHTRRGAPRRTDGWSRAAGSTLSTPWSSATTSDSPTRLASNPQHGGSIDGIAALQTASAASRVHPPANTASRGQADVARARSSRS